VDGRAKAEACAEAARSASQVTTLAGNPAAKGCVDGDGQAALMNETVAVAVSPDGRRVLIADRGNHVIREYNIATRVVRPALSVSPCLSVRVCFSPAPLLPPPPRS